MSPRNMRLTKSKMDLAQGRHGRDNAQRLLEGSLKVQFHLVDAEVNEKYECES